MWRRWHRLWMVCAFSEEALRRTATGFGTRWADHSRRVRRATRVLHPSGTGHAPGKRSSAAPPARRQPQPMTPKPPHFSYNFITSVSSSKPFEKKSKLFFLLFRSFSQSVTETKSEVRNLFGKVWSFSSSTPKRFSKVVSKLELDLWKSTFFFFYFSLITKKFYKSLFYAKTKFIFESEIVSQESQTTWQNFL